MLTSVCLGDMLGDCVHGHATHGTCRVDGSARWLDEVVI